MNSYDVAALHPMPKPQPGETCAEFARRVCTVFCNRYRSLGHGGRILLVHLNGIRDLTASQLRRERSRLADGASMGKTKHAVFSRTQDVASNAAAAIVWDKSKEVTV